MLKLMQRFASSEPQSDAPAIAPKTDAAQLFIGGAWRDAPGHPSVLLLEWLPGRAVKSCHAQEAIGFIIFGRIVERNARQVHLEPLTLQAGRLFEDIFSRKVTKTLLQDIRACLRRE